MPKLTRPEKILICIYELAKGTQGKLRYEDIVVELFKKYPDEFSLRGYSQYPDSEGVNKELYRASLKRSGLIDYSNKIFSLTELGIDRIKKILGSKAYEKEDVMAKLPRFADNEVNRIKTTEGFHLFSLGNQGSITDTDFFNYLGVTPRTPKGDFLMRFKTLQEVIEQLKPTNTSPLHKKIIDYHYFLIDKFKDIVKHFTA